MNIKNLEQMIAVAKSRGATEESEVFVCCYGCININVSETVTLFDSYGKSICVKTNKEYETVKWE